MPEPGTSLITSDPNATPVVGDDHFTKAEGFPEDLAPKVAKFADIPSLAKGYTELAAQLGSSFRLPKEDATPEEKTAAMAKIHAALGKPESPDKYEIKQPANLPAGMAWSPEIEAEAKKWAHAQGLNNAQLQSATDLYNGIRAKEVTALKARMDTDKAAAETALKAEWGESKFAVGLASAKEAFTKQVAAKYPRLAQVFEAVGLGDDADFVKWMADIYDLKIGEGKVIPGEPPKGPPGRKFVDYSRVDA